MTTPTLAELRAAVAAATTPTEHAHALNQLAEELEKHGQYAESLAAAEEAYTLAKQTEDITAQAKALRLQGEVHFQTENYSKALPLWEQLIDLLEEFGERSGVARITIKIANIYNRLSNYSQALKYYTRTLLLNEELENRSGIAGGTLGLGLVSYRLSDFNQALEYYTHALALYEELGDRSGMANAIANIGLVYASLSDYNQALTHYRHALALYEELCDRSSIARVTGSIGIVYSNFSDYNQSLEYFTAALALHEELGDHSGMAILTGNIGNVYFNLLDYHQALRYYTHALTLHEELGDRSSIASVTGNIGNVYSSLSDYKGALQYHTAALALYEELGERSGVARVTGNIGNVYHRLGDYPQVLEYYTRSVILHEELGDRYSAARVTGNIASLYAQESFSDYNPTKAEELLHKTITLNQELGAKDQLYDAHQFLARLYEQQGRWEEALQQFKKFHEIYQEVQSEEAHKKATQVEQQRQIAEMEKRTAAERARAKATEELLHKTLPPSIADRMISGEQHIADRFDSTSILFADVVGFTPMTASMPASAVLEFMNFVFAHFDSIAAKHGCERIKTIGDGYMAVCGAPIACEDHAERIARMAMEMLEDITLPESITEHLPPGTEFEIRIGLHCGSITAGVIGVGKLAYDIYGDAVNTASRMESHGEAGKIHVSEAFAEALFGTIQPSSVPSPITTHQVPITLAERGVLEIKGKGQLRTYFLTN